MLIVFAACGGDTDDSEAGAGAGGAPETDGSGEGGTDVAADPEASLIFYDAAGNEHLDPHEANANSSLSQEQLWAVYDRLVHLTPEGDPIPGLATEWSYNDDLTQFTMTLREGVKFHDGTPFNADAVVTNLQRQVDLGAQVGATVKNALAFIASFEAVDESTVTVDLTEPTGQMAFWFSQQPGMMVSPAALEGGNVGVDLEPVGTGPFRVKSFESLGVSVYERNEDYWDGTEGRPATFEHHYVPEGQARLNAVQSGQANLAIIDASQIPAAEAAGLEVQINPQTSLWNIYVNNGKDHPTGDQKVRQAIMHAIDRDALVDNLTFGSGQSAVQLFPEGSPVYDEELAGLYPYDPDKSRELLTEAGFPDGFTLDFILLNNSEYRQLAEAIQQMLAEVGITVEFEIVDIAQGNIFYTPPPRGDVMMARWGGRPDPLMTFQETVGSTGTYSPLGAIASPEIDELIAEARVLTPEDPERLDVIRELNRVVTEQAANFPIMIRSNVFAYETDCISDLDPYLTAGDDNMNNVKVSEGCG